MDKPTSSFPLEAYRNLVELAVDPMTLINQTGEILYQNTASEFYFGWTPAELVGENIFDFVHPDDVEVALSAASRIWAGDDVDRIIIRFRTQTGEWRRVEVVASVGWEDNLFLNSRDVTEREIMLDQIRQSSERFSTAFNASSTRLAIIADISSGRASIVVANNAFAGFVGLTPEQCVGRTVADLGVIADESARDALLRRLKAEGIAHQHQMLLTNCEGEERVFLVDVELIDDGSELFHFNAIDITEREATEQQLFQVKQMEAVGRLSGGIAHDFNNMLTVIMGHAELIRTNAGASDNFLGSLDNIQNAASKGAALVRKLLAFSKKTHLQAEPILVIEAVQSLIELMRPALPPGIEIRLDLSCDWKSFLDPGLLDSALMNLVLNARDAMPQGGLLKIKVRGRRLTGRDVDLHGLPEGEYLELELTDTGHGMSEQTLERLFEPFFTTKEDDSGTGLGLSMVYGFVSQSGGLISAASEPGEGTTFHVYLPRHLD